MKYQVTRSSSFKRDYKRAKKRGQDLSELHKVVATLAEGKSLSDKYKDHSLSGKYSGFRECHIEPDWLLIYRFEEDVLVLMLYRTGTHSDLF